MRKGMIMILWAAILVVLMSAGQGSEAAALSQLQLTVTPEKLVQDNLAVDSAFLISAPQEVTAEEIRQRLMLNGTRAYALTETADGCFRLTPETAFAVNELVRLTLTDAAGRICDQWAWQTTPQLLLQGIRHSDPTSYMGREVECVELSFNLGDVDLESLRAAFRITPEADGEFKRRGSMVLFVPQSPLASDTVYEITVADNTVRTASGAVLAQGQRYAFRTNSALKPFGNYSPYMTESFLPGDPHLLDIYLDEDLVDRRYLTTIYRFADAEAYRVALALTMLDDCHRRALGDVATADMAVVMRFESKPEQLEEGAHSYILLPQQLPEGWYLAEVSLVDDDGYQHLRQFIQVSPLAVYSGAYERQALVWVNDTSSGQPAEGAAVTITAQGQSAQGSTDTRGTVTLDWALRDVYWEQQAALLVQWNGHAFVDRMLLYPSKPTGSEDYLNYLYLDREVYRPTDVARVWGLIQPRREQLAQPESLSLALVLSLAQQEEILVETTLTVNDAGVFSGELAFSQLVQPEGYDSTCYSLQLRFNDTVLCRKPLHLETAQRPPYLLTVSDWPQAYVADPDTPISVNIRGQYGDQTAAAKQKLYLTVSDESDQLTAQYPHELKLDEQGLGSFTISPQWDEVSWRPRLLRWQLRAQAAPGALGLTRSTIVLPRDSLLDVQFTATDQGTEAMITANAIRLPEALDAQAFWQGFPENITGEPLDIPVHAELIHRFSPDYLDEGYYDFINKRQVGPIYKFHNQEDLVRSWDFTTKNGRYVLKDLPLKGDYHDHYILYLSYQDSLGRATVEKYSLLYKDAYPGYPWRSYSFVDAGIDPDLDKDPRANTVSAERPLRMLIAEGRMPVSPQAGTRYLTALAQKEISQVQVGIQPWRDITPDQALPNAVLFGAYFDGRHIYPIEESTVRLDPADRALHITLSADRPSYQPGDTAALHLTVTDAQGQPVPNARLAISVVDDARYMLEPPDVAVLSELYRLAYTPTISDYASLTQHDLFCIVHVSPEIVEEPPIRYPYASQTASQLINAVTGPDGRAAVRLHLGETAAKWHVTAIGITDDLRAGTGDLCLDAPLPFALEARQFISYFDGSLQVTAQASGTAVTLNAPITYQCVLTDSSGVIQTEQAASKGHTLQTFDLGRPPTGQYTLHVTARCGEHEAQQSLNVTIDGDAPDARLTALS